MSRLVDLTLIKVHETALAYIVAETDEPGAQTHALPKSLVELEVKDRRKDIYEFTMPEWLALEKGLI